MQILRNVSRAAYAMGIRGYTEKVGKCHCGTDTNVIWHSLLAYRDVLACTQECANLPPPIKRQQPKEPSHE